MTLRSIVPRAGVPQRPDVTSLECDQNCGKPKVMQQYRKQLSGFARPGGGKLTISQLERPGGSVVIDISDSVTSCGHCGSHCLEYVEECIEWAPNVEELITAIDWPPVKDFKTGTYYTDASANEYGVCISCDPQSRVIRSMTKPRLQFHDSTATYLQSRCMTYDQRLSIQKIPGIVYIDPVTKLPLPPSEYSEGAQSYQASPCVRTCGNGQIIPVVYKPNNTGFARQGAVSGGARTASLGHNVQTVNGGSYGTAYGLSAANYGDYQGEETGSYYIKTQPQRCIGMTFFKGKRKHHGGGPGATNVQLTLTLTDSFYLSPVSVPFGTVGGCWCNGVVYCTFAPPSECFAQGWGAPSPTLTWHRVAQFQRVGDGAAFLALLIITADSNSPCAACPPTYPSGTFNASVKPEDAQFQAVSNVSYGFQPGDRLTGGLTQPGGPAMYAIVDTVVPISS